jgi:hypothetical protein
MSRKLTRRDRCWLVGLRAAKLSPEACVHAWTNLSVQLVDLYDKDIPKFDDLLHAIRRATLEAKSK